MTSTITIPDSLDFRAMAQAIAGGALKIREDGQLIPTEARVRRQREGSQFMSPPRAIGSTVDQEGLINNYAIEPSMYYAVFPSAEQVRAYLLQGAVAIFFVTSVILTACAVS